MKKRTRLSGAARTSVVKKIMGMSAWDEKADVLHDLIEEYHQDQQGHEVCGCEVHQAFCPECSPIYEGSN